MHNFNRYQLYNVTSDRLIRRKLIIKRSWLPWTKKYKVEEYAVYECSGRHHNYLNLFVFIEEEYTGFKKEFDKKDEATKWIKEEFKRDFSEREKRMKLNEI